MRTRTRTHPRTHARAHTQPHPLPPLSLFRAGWASPLALRPAAVVFIAHGCSHSARDVFVAGADLPEEAAWARAALARRLAVVAVSSGDREGSRCWRAADAPPVARALAEVARRERWVGLPLFAVGASSGGAFVSTAPAWLPPAGGGPSAFPLRLRGLGVQISSVPSVDKTITASYPPVAFVHMPRDERTAAEVDVAVERLERLGVPVASFAAMPKAVTAAFLAARMRSRAGERTGEDARGGASAAAQRVAEALAAAGMVDADGFLLRASARASERQGSTPARVRRALARRVHVRSSPPQPRFASHRSLTPRRPLPPTPPAHRAHVAPPTPRSAQRTREPRGGARRFAPRAPRRPPPPTASPPTLRRSPRPSTSPGRRTSSPRSTPTRCSPSG